MKNSKRAVVVLTALGTVVGSLTLGNPPAQAVATLQPTPPSHTCATGWTAVVVDSTNLCEQRFTDAAPNSPLTMTVPTGVSSMKFFVVGGGGGGGGALNDLNFYAAASSGGGGGEVTECTQAVTPGDAWTVVVGAGGAAGATRTSATTASDATNFGGTGGNSSVTKGGDTCVADGGLGGGPADGSQSSGPCRSPVPADRPRTTSSTRQPPRR